MYTACYFRQVSMTIMHQCPQDPRARTTTSSGSTATWTDPCCLASSSPPCWWSRCRTSQVRCGHPCGSAEPHSVLTWTDTSLGKEDSVTSTEGRKLSPRNWWSSLHYTWREIKDLQPSSDPILKNDSRLDTMLTSMMLITITFLQETSIFAHTASNRVLPVTGTAAICLWTAL